MSYVTRQTPLGPRVRGLRARYLPRDKLLGLIQAATLDDALSILKGTDYGPVLERLGKITDEYQVANEIKTHIVRVIAEIARSVPEPASRVLRTFVLKAEFDNIKTIAKALMRGLEPSQIEKMLNVGVEEALGRRHIIASLLGARDVDDLRGKLTSLNHPAAYGLEVYSKLGKQYPQYSLMLLDTSLDKAFIESLLQFSRYDVSIRKFVEELANFYNISVALRGRLWGLSHEVINELIVKAGPIAQVVVRAYAESPVRLLEESAQTFRAVDLLIKTAGTSDLRTLVQFLGPFTYRFAKDLEEYIVSLFTEFSPGAALAASYFKLVEGETIIALINAFLEGVPRDHVVRLYSPIIT